VKCVICKHGETRPGVATLVLERDGLTVVVKRVPAQVCETCGEEYVDEAAAASVLERTELAAQQGVEVVIRDFAAA